MYILFKCTAFYSLKIWRAELNTYLCSRQEGENPSKDTFFQKSLK
jgi:hypothetical protein